MALPYIRHKNITASTLVENHPCFFYGFMVNSHTSGTLKVWDSQTAANDVVFNTMSFAAGSGLMYIFPFPILISVGLFATIGGTADITLLYGEIER
jgi:hypothetical protein